MLMTLCACAHTKLTDWDKSGEMLADFNADSKACQMSAYGYGYNTCTEARGYTLLWASFRMRERLL
jgi:hypothetical protein